MKIIPLLFMVGFGFQTLAQGTSPTPRTPMAQNPVSPQSPEQQPAGKLTPEQLQKLKELRLRFMKEALPLKNELKEKEARLQTLRTVDAPDMNQIGSIMDDIGRIKTNLAKKKEVMLLDFRKSLNEEQRVMFDTDRRTFLKNAHSNGKGHKEKYKKGQDGPPNSGTEEGFED
jgi:hypothetical protein